MPVLAPPIRYRPSLRTPPFVPGVMSPFDEEVSPAFDPRVLDAPPLPPITETRIEAPPPRSPEAMPQIAEAIAQQRKPVMMPPPGQPEIKEALPPSPPVVQAAPPAPTGRAAMPAPPIEADIPPAEIQPPQVPAAPSRAHNLGERPPSPADLQLRSATENLNRAQAAKPAAPHNNWGQRIATAILAMTKFAPATDQIVHPKWSDQERQYRRDQESAEDQFNTAKGAIDAEGLKERREAESASKYASIAQRDLALDQSDAAREQKTEEAASRIAQQKSERNRKILTDQTKGRDSQYQKSTDERPPNWEFIEDPDNPGMGFAVEPAWQAVTPEIAPYLPGIKVGELVSASEIQGARKAAVAAKAVAEKPQPEKVPTNIVEWEAILNDPKASPEKKAQAKGILDTELARVKAGRVAPAVAAGGSSDDPKVIAQAIVDGNQPPNLQGLYRMGAPVRAELARKGYDLATAQRDWTAIQRHLGTLNGQQQERLRQAVSFTTDSLDIINDLYGKWQKVGPASGFKVLNRAALQAAKQVPGETGSIATNLEAQINDLTSELGTVYKGGNASTDESLRLAAENLKADWNEQTFKSAIDQIRKNLKIRSNSIMNSQPAGVSANSPYLPQGGGSNPAPQSGTIHYSDGKDSWDIPAADEKRFIVTHPNAKKQ